MVIFIYSLLYIIHVYYSFHHIIFHFSHCFISSSSAAASAAAAAICSSTLGNDSLIASISSQDGSVEVEERGNNKTIDN